MVNREKYPCKGKGALRLLFLFVGIQLHFQILGHIGSSYVDKVQGARSPFTLLSKIVIFLQ